MSTETQTMEDTQVSLSSTEQMSGPAKKSRFSVRRIISYMQNQAKSAGEHRHEGSSYLNSNGKEPQQRYKYGHEKNEAIEH